MYFDRRLWELTAGLRGRIALAILIGLVASGFGIARFVLLLVILCIVLLVIGLAQDILHRARTIHDARQTARQDVERHPDRRD